MVWFFATIILLATIFFAIVSEGFRAFLLVVVGLAVVGGFWLYNNAQKENARREQATQLARTLIPFSKLKFDNFHMSPNYSGSDSFTLSGLVTNQSEHQLQHLSLTVTLENCSAPGVGCVVVGQAKNVGDYDTLAIPPKQARQLQTLVFFQNLPPLNSWQWHYTINYVEAQ